LTIFSFDLSSSWTEVDEKTYFFMQTNYPYCRVMSKGIESRLSTDKGTGGQVERVKVKINIFEIIIILSEKE
jgi:hypothetical protein